MTESRVSTTSASGGPSLLADSLICARCDGRMVITKDALQRDRKRCPRCDGVAAPRTPHPDEVKRPLTLAALTAMALPPVEPGQLRCQRCARGVDGDARFCERCEYARELEQRGRPCPDCGNLFLPTVSSPRRCVPCQEKANAPRPRLCLNCNRLKSGVRGSRVVNSCNECRSAPPPRPSRQSAAPANQLPRQPGARYRDRECGRRDCDTVFTPTGPRSTYCEAHR